MARKKYFDFLRYFVRVPPRPPHAETELLHSDVMINVEFGSRMPGWIPEGATTSKGNASGPKIKRKGVQ